MLTLTSLTIWLCREQAVSSGSGFADSSRSGLAGSKLVVVEFSFSPLTIWLCWKQAGCSGSGFAGRGESGFAGWGESGFAGQSGRGFAGSKLVVVDWASLVGGVI
jgi:hypothetical protein